MRKITFIGLLFLALTPPAPAQSRSDTFNASDVNVNEATLTELADGGCSVRWCGSVTSTDGGTKLSGCTTPRELSNGANRTQCLNSLALGENRLANEMKFPVDAGSQ